MGFPLVGKKWRGKACNRFGFTLMELMVVIALIGVVFSVVLPNFERVFEVGALDEAVRTVAGRLQNQRKTAMQSQSPQFLVVDLDLQAIRASGPMDELTGEETLDSEKAKQGRLPQGVIIRDVQWPDGKIESMGQVRLAISPKGYVEYTALHLEDSDNQVTVFLEPFLGRIRMEEGYVSLEPE